MKTGHHWKQRNVSRSCQRKKVNHAVRTSKHSTLTHNVHIISVLQGHWPKNKSSVGYKVDMKVIQGLLKTNGSKKTTKYCVVGRVIFNSEHMLCGDLLTF